MGWEFTIVTQEEGEGVPVRGVQVGRYASSDGCLVLWLGGGLCHFKQLV